MAARPLEKAVHLVRLRPVQLEPRRNRRCLTIHSAVVPCLILGGINAYNLWTEHWEHWNHLPPLEERVEYPYQNVRVKNFPWGDGDKVSSASRYLRYFKFSAETLLFRRCCKLNPQKENMRNCPLWTGAECRK
jgi:hypothetical protein